MKRVLEIGVLLCLCGVMMAAERSAEDAMQIAASMVRERVSSGAHRAPARVADPEIVDRGASYYAVKTGAGFVLVGADDRLQEVLGYADEGEFDPTNENLMYWLSCYDEELKSVNDNDNENENDNDNDNENVDGGKVVRRVTGFKESLAPLMKSKWNQSAPYNKLCPTYEGDALCVTGCVATAMAQVMYYHQHPAKGSGSHMYLWLNEKYPLNSQWLSADFGSTTYDWGNMLPVYNSNYNEAQAMAVATLMYHCGVSIDMGYGPSSGAFTNQVPAALEKYFGYDPNYQRIRRELYPIDSLNQIVRAELRAGRPVLISGSNDEGGHAFVCDGYDTRAYFHINWGWGGGSDGYYLLSALNPGNQGIGGTTKGYNKGTELYVGLQPKKTGTVRLPAQMGADSIGVNKLTYTRSGSITATIYKLQNFGINSFSGNYGFALYKEQSDELVTVLKQSSDYTLGAGYYRTSAAQMSFSIPTTVAKGTYRLCAVYKETGKDWQRMMCRYDEYYKTIYVTSTAVEIRDNHEPPSLVLASAIVVPKSDSVPYTGVPVSFSIKNNGGTFRGDISARIYQGNFSRGQYEIVEDVVIMRGETFSSALQQQFAESLKMGTKYKMKLCYRLGATDSWKDLTPTEYDVHEFTLYDPFPKLSLTEQIHFADNDAVLKSGGELFYSIKNTGATFRGELMVAFREGNFARGTWDPIPVTIATGETLVGSIASGFEHPAGNYTAHLRYRASENESWTLVNNDSVQAIIAFTLIDDSPVLVNISDSICEGGSYLFAGKTLLEAGTYIDTTRSIVTGFDSITTLVLTVTPAPVIPVEQTICAGESYMFGGKQLSDAGIYRDTTYSVEGCMSISELTLTVEQPVQWTVEASFYKGDEYVDETTGKIYTQGGTYSDTLQTVAGCDSIYTLVLTEMEKLVPTSVNEVSPTAIYDVYDTVGHCLMWGATLKQAQSLPAGIYILRDKNEATITKKIYIL